jgi:hypothetical protein
VVVVAEIGSFGNNARFFDCGAAKPSTPGATGEDGQYDNIIVGTAAAQALFFEVKQSAIYRQAISPSAILQPSTLYQIITTVEGNRMRSFVNGVKVAEVVSNSDWEPRSLKRGKCFLGQSNWGTNDYFNGQISGLGIHSGAMTEDEVTKHYYDFTTYTYTSQTVCARNIVFKGALRQCCGFATTIVIDASVTTIKNQAFRDCRTVQHVDFTAATSLLSIGNLAFSLGYASKLVSVDLSPATKLTTIGTEAFRHCKNLNAVKMSSSITTIRSLAFRDGELAANSMIEWNGVDCPRATKGQVAPFDWMHPSYTCDGPPGNAPAFPSGPGDTTDDYMPMCQKCITFTGPNDPAATVLCQDKGQNCAPADAKLDGTSGYVCMQHANTGTPGAPKLCRVGVDWSLLENRCQVPVDILFMLDESGSVSDTDWSDAKTFIKNYAVNLNGGAQGTGVGTGDATRFPIHKKQIRLSVMQWAGSDGKKVEGVASPVQQHIGIHFIPLAGDVLNGDRVDPCPLVCQNAWAIDPWPALSESLQYYAGLCSNGYTIENGADERDFGNVPCNTCVFCRNSGTSITGFLDALSNLERKFHSTSCPGEAARFALKRSICSKDVQGCVDTGGDAFAKRLGFRDGEDGTSTVVVFLTDGNPATTEQCGLSSSQQREEYISKLKQRVDRIIPVGISSNVDIGTLTSLSHNMPAGKSYVAAQDFASGLMAEIDELTRLSCPTLAPTSVPTLKPTSQPTTTKPTAAPTFSSSCSPEEKTKCGWPNNVYSLCTCKDQTCSEKVCSCSGVASCANPECNQCTVAPTASPVTTSGPSSAPSRVPSTHPTRSPTHSVACDAADVQNGCDIYNGLCSKDGTGNVFCTCKSGFSCASQACGQCTLAPTASPTALPSRAPTTQQPSAAPTFGFVCSPSERLACDPTIGTCYCGDSLCTFKTCGCSDGFACSDAGCSVCTAAPTSSPSQEPTVEPTATPTLTPTFYDLFGDGEISAEDAAGGVVTTESVTVAAGLTGVALVLLILGIIACVVIGILIFLFTTGAGAMLVYRFKSVDVSDVMMEGEIVKSKSVPVGVECEPPAWATMRGGNGVNPMGNHRTLKRPLSSFIIGLQRTFSRRTVRTNNPLTTEMAEIDTETGNSDNNETGHVVADLQDLGI